MPTLGGALIVSYGSQAVREIALDSAAAAARFGELAAAWLRAMLAEAEAADDASELLSLYGEAALVSGTNLTVDFAPGLVANFVVVDDRSGTSTQSSMAWNTIRRLKLMEVRTDGTGD